MTRSKWTVSWAVHALLLTGCGFLIGEEPNQLTEAEAKAGWRLLFDGESSAGWRNYGKQGVSDGWQVIDGALTRVGSAGDLITEEQFDRFELALEFKISPRGNSGVMYHVVESTEYGSPYSGPEVQIQDNVAGRDPQKCGWLYQLYDSPIDATRPAGEWNKLRLRVAPDQCVIFVNGVRYARYVMGSRDWNRRVAASKFARYANFGKSGKGHICLQDHGDEVAYRDIKIRALQDGDHLEPSDGSLAYGPAPAFSRLRWNEWSPEDESGRANPLRPIVLTHAGDGTNRVFVATQQGVIHVFPNDQRAAETKVFLDISAKVRYSDRQNEEGFLGLAFHPRYAENGQFFAYYTATGQPRESVISRFRVSADDPNRADPDFEEEIMRIEQPYWNHNGGTIAFGPDGYLYVGLGDGGSANDPHGNGQNLGVLLGSILRIDVDRKNEGLGYAIPDDNPFVATPGARGEIWAYGLRNVWQLGFDRQTGDLWVGDVGQDLWEEIDIVKRGGNYGWNLREGMHPFGAHGSGADAKFEEPVWEYDHETGRSITGGYVYRGSRLPELVGAYIYADYVSGRIWALRVDPKSHKVISNSALRDNGQPIISFGEDEQGEIYFMVVALDGRGLFRFAKQD